MPKGHKASGSGFENKRIRPAQSSPAHARYVEPSRSVVEK